MAEQSQDAKLPENYIDAGITALTKLRDLLTPRDIQITDIKGLERGTFIDRAQSSIPTIALTLTLHVPLPSLSSEDEGSSNDKNLR